ncbi:MarR family winged helix-turn-helix transcriptional regulator [Rhizobium sp. HT1-10]|uniref:MarR family winged helix-turn-helix transcriptional regulator n=1 Tax=Rhizobium sp. HT1-10 TaxID=3111638 RepID=UPI003C2A0DB5
MTALSIRKIALVKKSKGTISQAEYAALAKFRYTLRRFLDFSSSAAVQEGLPAQQHQALLTIKGFDGEGPIHVGALAEQLMIVPHAAAELVGRLVAAGYVTRQVDPADRRRHGLYLTEKSEDVLTRLTAIHLKEIRELAPRLIQALSSLGSANDGELE